MLLPLRLIWADPDERPQFSGVSKKKRTVAPAPMISCELPLIEREQIQ